MKYIFLSDNSTSSSGTANNHVCISYEASLGLFPKQLLPTYLLVEKIISKHEAGKP